MESFLRNRHQNLFLYFCKIGYLDGIKDLLNSYDDVNINKNDDQAFRTACGYGHIDIIKFLLSFPNNNIFINTWNDDAFRWACECGHDDVVKLLLNTPNNNINIRACHDDAFEMSCSYGYHSIAKLLCNMCSNYNVETKDNKVTNWFIDSVSRNYARTRTRTISKTCENKQ